MIWSSSEEPTRDTEAKFAREFGKQAVQKRGLARATWARHLFSRIQRGL